MKLRITLLWAASAAANLGVVLSAPPAPRPPGPAPALAEYLARRAAAERPEALATAAQLLLLAAGLAVAWSAARRLDARFGRSLTAAVGAALGFGAAFFVALQLVMLFAVAIPDFAIAPVEEGIIVGWLERSFLAAWLVAVGGAPLGAALLHGGRPLDLRALAAAQLAAGLAGAASIAVATFSRQLVLPPRPVILFPALVVIAASAAGFLRARAATVPAPTAELGGAVGE